MDPKENTEPSNAKDAQTNTSDVTSADATPPAGMGSAPSLSPDSTDTSIGDSSQGASQGVEVDLSTSPDASATGVAGATTPATPDSSTSTDPAASPVAFDADAQTPTAASDASGPSVDVNPPTPDATPSATPDFGTGPAANAGQTFGAAQDTDAPLTGQQTSGAPSPDQAAGVPPTAPVPAHVTEKKTIVVLAGVAVILIVAIVVLFLL